MKLSQLTIGIALSGLLVSGVSYSTAYAHGNSGLEAGALEVVLSEWSLGIETVEVDDGTLPIHVVNDGRARHDLTVVRTDSGSKVDKTRLLGPGETAELSLELSEGRYDLYCSVPGHRGAGMVASLIVGEDADDELSQSGNSSGFY